MLTVFRGFSCSRIKGIRGERRLKREHPIGEYDDSNHTVPDNKEPCLPTVIIMTNQVKRKIYIISFSLATNLGI